MFGSSDVTIGDVTLPVSCRRNGRFSDSAERLAARCRRRVHDDGWDSSQQRQSLPAEVGEFTEFSPVQSELRVPALIFSPKIHSFIYRTLPKLRRSGNLFKP